MPVSQSDFTKPTATSRSVASLPRRTLIALGLGFAIVATGLTALDPAMNVVLAAPDDDNASFWLSERKRHAPSQEALNRQAQQQMQLRRQAQYQQQMRLQQQKQQQLQQQMQQQMQQQAQRRSQPLRFSDLLPWNRVVTITPRGVSHAPALVQIPASPAPAHVPAPQARPQLVMGVLSSFDTVAKPAANKIAPAAPKPKPPALCVRLCDGSYFPAPGTGSATQEDCARACPRAPTRLYKTSNGDISTAISAVDGASYFALPVAMRFSKVRDQTCTCGSSDPMATILNDATLRQGDRVMTADGFRLFKGGARPPFTPRNFQSVEQARHLPASERAVLRSMERATGVRPGVARSDAFAALSAERLPTGATTQ